jgi:hypothetical protein
MYSDAVLPERDGPYGRLGSMRGSAFLSGLANFAWKTFQVLNQMVPEGEQIAPKWAPGKLLKSYERTAPVLGVPRKTDSLCPKCVKEIRDAVIKGQRDLSDFYEKHSGEVKADIVEVDGRVIMKKTCPKYGDFEDILSTNVEWTRRIESLFFGRDFRCGDDSDVHKHGTSTIKFGRGSVLTVDLTNRCNMMCNLCFMDANQVGYVLEPSWEDVKAILDRAVSFKPKRQSIVLFSGGEPTVAPTFLKAVEYAREVGFYRILAATNGIRFAQDPEFTRQAREAGLHGAYLQFDGVGEDVNAHRGVSNLFDVKLQAIENMAKVGMKATLVTTILNGINNHSIGKIVEFAMKNIDSVQTIAFQPVSFTGRNENVDDRRRKAQRYTLSEMTEDLRRQLGAGLQPMRDWFPLSTHSAFTSVMDMLAGADAPWGWSACNCHPNCGIFTLLLVNRMTGEWCPIFRFFDYEQFIKDVAVITDKARGRTLTAAQLGLAIMRNYDARKAPKSFPIGQLISLFKPASESASSDRNDRMKTRTERDEWRILCVEGMWFQDLYTYDFRRTEMCVIPYGTQEGEVSFCAYNTGVGWRQLIENMRMTATTAEWYRNFGRHKVYAAGKSVELPTTEHNLVLPLLDNTAPANSSVPDVHLSDGK